MVAVSRAGARQLDWGTVVGALVESGYDYVLCVENEDRGMPGLGRVRLRLSASSAVFAAAGRALRVARSAVENRGL